MRAGHLLHPRFRLCRPYRVWYAAEVPVAGALGSGPVVAAAAGVVAAEAEEAEEVEAEAEEEEAGNNVILNF